MPFPVYPDFSDFFLFGVVDALTPILAGCSREYPARQTLVSAHQRQGMEPGVRLLSFHCRSSSS